MIHLASILYGQFPPPAGQPGTTAMYKDSSAFHEWANRCILEAGYINFVDTSVVYQGSNKANWGFPEDATGPPDNFVVSLGDHGTATLTFPCLISDSAGPDFAIFENSFSNEFLELGFVEASSNGIDFVRFPSVSLTQDTLQIPTFGTIDATKIHNLAGKYRVFYGTPFDLADLKDSLAVDITAITHIRITDVGGCIQPGYQSFDSQGHVINDPWPTAFNTCGLDLDAVGVIHFGAQAVQTLDEAVAIRLYPNPVHDCIHIEHAQHTPLGLAITDPLGKVFLSKDAVRMKDVLDVSAFPKGLYFAIFTLPDNSSMVRRFIKN